MKCILNYIIYILLLFVSCKKTTTIDNNSIENDSSDNRTIPIKINKEVEPQEKDIVNDILIIDIREALAYDKLKQAKGVQTLISKKIPNRHNKNKMDLKETLVVNSLDTLEYYVTSTNKILLRANIYSSSLLEKYDLKLGVHENVVIKKLNIKINFNEEIILIKDIENSTHLILNFKNQRLKSINVKNMYLG